MLYSSVTQTSSTFLLCTCILLNLRIIMMEQCIDMASTRTTAFQLTVTANFTWMLKCNEGFSVNSWENFLRRYEFVSQSRIYFVLIFDKRKSVSFSNATAKNTCAWCECKNIQMLGTYLTNSDKVESSFS